LTAITQNGIRHWKFDLYHNKGYGSQALTVEQQSIRVWENDTTEYNYCLTCEKSIVIDILTDYLEKKAGIQIDELQELIQIEEKEKKKTSRDGNLSSAELALYYQYRPLPPISSFDNDDNDKPAIKSIHLKHKETEEVKMWKSQAIIGADGQTSFVRQKLGIIFYTYTNIKTPRYSYLLCKSRYSTEKLQQ
jgi:hypothetical protein